MKKRLFLLTALLTAALGTGVLADQTVTYGVNGFTLTYPESFDADKLKGVINPHEGTVENGIGSFAIYYYAMPKEEFHEITAKDEDEITDEDVERVSGSQGILAEVYSIDGGRDVSDLLAAYDADPGLADYFTEVGKASDITFYCVTDVPGATDVYLESIEKPYAEEYTVLQEAFVDALKNAKYTEPKPRGTDLIGTKLEFETTDAQGNTVRSEEIFKEHAVTMINVWATTCHWCLEEMPDLAETNHALAEKDAGIIGICLDADRRSDVFHEILEEKGVDYPNLLPFEGIDQKLEVVSFPTTYFVDREGTILSLPVVGVPSDMSGYTSVIEKLLQGETVQPEAKAPQTNDAGVYRVVVADSEGELVEGVTVQFCSDNACMFGETDEDGTAEFKGEEGTVYKIHVLEVPDGYEETAEEFSTAGEYCDIRIVLQKEQ